MLEFNCLYTFKHRQFSILRRNPSGHLVILIFSGQILYQNNLKHIAFFLTLFKGYRCNKSSVVTPKKKKKKKKKFPIGAQGNKCQISQYDILHMKFSEIYPCFHNCRKICRTFIFLGSHNKFSLLLLQITNYNYSP